MIEAKPGVNGLGRFPSQIWYCRSVAVQHFARQDRSSTGIKFRLGRFEKQVFHVCYQQLSQPRGIQLFTCYL